MLQRNLVESYRFGPARTKGPNHGIEGDGKKPPRLMPPVRQITEALILKGKKRGQQ